MAGSRQVIFKLISFLLGYPDGDVYWDSLKEVEACLDLIPSARARGWLTQAVQTLKDSERSQLRQQYVRSFDFRESTCLYLTAHEYGDSRDRGVALLELHRFLRHAGFEESTGELLDYLPGLFEFLSAKPEHVPTDELEQRLAQVCHRILEHLGEESATYIQVFCAALEALPKVEYKGETIEFPNREKADVDELPYPIQFEQTSL